MVYYDPTQKVIAKINIQQLYLRLCMLLLRSFCFGCKSKFACRCSTRLHDNIMHTTKWLPGQHTYTECLPFFCFRTLPWRLAAVALPCAF